MHQCRTHFHGWFLLTHNTVVAKSKHGFLSLSKEKAKAVLHSHSDRRFLTSSKEKLATKNAMSTATL